MKLGHAVSVHSYSIYLKLGSNSKNNTNILERANHYQALGKSNLTSIAFLQTGHSRFLASSLIIHP